MPRRLRQCPGGIIYHVLNRAVAKIDLFKAARDHEAFQKVLREAKERVPVDVLAYCVMSNHWHLVLRPKGDGDLSSFMQWLTLTHVQRWRAAHQTVGFGPLYQGRFRAFPIEEDPHLLTVLRYVERNPVRAGIVTQAQDWKWGSLHTRTSGTAEDKVILAKWPIDQPADWVNFVNTPQTAAEEQDMELSIRRSRPYGTPHWQERTAKALGLLSSLHDPGRPKNKKNRK
jgi:putative transposase